MISLPRTVSRSVVASIGWPSRCVIEYTELLRFPVNSSSTYGSSRTHSSCRRSSSTIPEWSTVLCRRSKQTIPPIARPPIDGADFDWIDTPQVSSCTMGAPQDGECPIVPYMSPSSKDSTPL